MFIQTTLSHIFFFYLIFYCLNVFHQGFGAELHPIPLIPHGNHSKCRQANAMEISKLLDVWWINLEREHIRRHSMMKMLKTFGLDHSYKFNALTPANIIFPEGLEKPESCKYVNRSMIQKEISKIPTQHRHHNVSALMIGHCSRGWNKNYVNELATTLSHAITTYRAVNHNIAKKYALIMEDDVTFSMSIDWERLIKSAPANFSMLQLITNNPAKSTELWEKYIKTGEIWERRYGGRFWSAGAFIVNKAIVRPVINSIIKPISRSLYTAFIYATNQTCPNANPICCQGSTKYPSPPCVQSGYGYSADYFMFNLVHDDSYISTFPIFLLNDHSKKSTLHQEFIPKQQPSVIFTRETIRNVISANHSLLPVFMHPTCLAPEITSGQN